MSIRDFEAMTSFIITARQEAPEILRRTIDELRATTPGNDRQILVIDDGTLAPVSALPSDVCVVRNEESIGVSRARRQGCALAEGNVLVCLDAHMTFDGDWLDHMLAHVDAGALLCSAFWDYERSTCHGFGADFEWSGERNYCEQLVPGFRLRHRVRHPRGAAVDVPMVIGACYMLSRSTYESLGGFSPLFRVWGADEQDLSARAWIAGFGVKCVTRACVGHLWRPAFPYPVIFEHLEFNQYCLVHTVFEDSTINTLERFFVPLPERVQNWVDEIDWAAWRAVIQRNRRWKDQDFFQRFVPNLHAQCARLPD